MYGLRPKIREMMWLWKPSSIAEVVEQARYVEEHVDLKGEGRAIFPCQIGFMGKAPRTFQRGEFEGHHHMEIGLYLECQQ